MKKIFAVCMAICILVSHENVKAVEFVTGSYCDPKEVEWQKKEVFTVYTDEDTLLGMAMVKIKIEERKELEDCLVFLETTMIPNTNAVAIDNKHQGYAFNEHLWTRSYVQEITHEYPMNPCPGDSNHLNITYTGSSGEGKYNVEYDYKPGIFDSDLLTEIHSNYGEIEYNSISNKFNLSGEITFGASRTQTKSYPFIYFGYSAKKKFYKEYTVEDFK